MVATVKILQTEVASLTSEHNTPIAGESYVQCLMPYWSITTKGSLSLNFSLGWLPFQRDLFDGNVAGAFTKPIFLDESPQLNHALGSRYGYTAKGSIHTPNWREYYQSLVADVDTTPLLQPLIDLANRGRRALLEVADTYDVPEHTALTVSEANAVKKILSGDDLNAREHSLLYTLHPGGIDTLPTIDVYGDDNTHTPTIGNITKLFSTRSLVSAPVTGAIPSGNVRVTLSDKDGLSPPEHDLSIEDPFGNVVSLRNDGLDQDSVNKGFLSIDPESTLVHSVPLTVGDTEIFDRLIDTLPPGRVRDNFINGGVPIAESEDIPLIIGNFSVGSGWTVTVGQTPPDRFGSNCESVKFGNKLVYDGLQPLVALRDIPTGIIGITGDRLRFIRTQDRKTTVSRIAQLTSDGSLRTTVSDLLARAKVALDALGQPDYPEYPGLLDVPNLASPSYNDFRRAWTLNSDGELPSGVMIDQNGFGSSFASTDDTDLHNFEYLSGDFGITIRVYGRRELSYRREARRRYTVSFRIVDGLYRVIVNASIRTSVEVIDTGSTRASRIVDGAVHQDIQISTPRWFETIGYLQQGLSCPYAYLEGYDETVDYTHHNRLVTGGGVSALPISSFIPLPWQATYRTGGLLTRIPALIGGVHEYIPVGLFTFRRTVIGPKNVFQAYLVSDN